MQTYQKEIEAIRKALEDKGGIEKAVIVKDRVFKEIGGKEIDVRGAIWFMIDRGLIGLDRDWNLRLPSETYTPPGGWP